MVLRLDLGGVRAEASGDDGGVPITAYDSVSSFLINNSPGYVAHFNSSLAAQLMLVAQQREEETETATDDADTAQT